MKLDQGQGKPKLGNNFCCSSDKRSIIFLPQVSTFNKRNRVLEIELKSTIKFVSNYRLIWTLNVSKLKEFVTEIS